MTDLPLASTLAAEERPPRLAAIRAIGADLRPAGFGVLMVLCCLAGPAVLGAVAGASVGGWLGLVAAAAVALATALLLRMRRRDGRDC